MSQIRKLRHRGNDPPTRLLMVISSGCGFHETLYPGVEPVSLLAPYRRQMEYMSAKELRAVWQSLGPQPSHPLQQDRALPHTLALRAVGAKS